MHVHMLLIRTIVLGIIGGILGGAVTHLFAPPTSERFHPAGLILSTLGAIVVLYRARDVRVVAQLRHRGWKVMRFWECDLKAETAGRVMRKLQAALGERRCFPTLLSSRSRYR